MTTARKVIAQEFDWMERADIEALSRELADQKVLPRLHREALERELRIWEFGKWALLGDGSPPAMEIKRQLKYVARYKEGQSDWRALSVMGDDDAVIYDKMLSAELGEEEKGVLLIYYQFWRSEETGSRILGVGRYHFRTVRDAALTTLASTYPKYFH